MRHAHCHPVRTLWAALRQPTVTVNMTNLKHTVLSSAHLTTTLEDHANYWEHDSCSRAMATSYRVTRGFAGSRTHKSPKLVGRQAIRSLRR